MSEKKNSPGDTRLADLVVPVTGPVFAIADGWKPVRVTAFIREVYAGGYGTVYPPKAVTGQDGEVYDMYMLCDQGLPRPIWEKVEAVYERRRRVFLDGGEPVMEECLTGCSQSAPLVLLPLKTYCSVIGFNPEKYIID